MRAVTAVTVARSDFGIYLPILRRLAADAAFRLNIIAAGTHLSREFGHTQDDITAAGFEISDRVETVTPSDTPADIAQSMGMGLLGFGRCYARHRPDLLLLVGDRYEMFSAASAAVPFAIPIAHVHGGETTEGAIDEVLRHGISKMSHLHFVSAAPYRDRLIQMGEEPWRITVSGAPALDNLRDLELATRPELERTLDLSLETPPLVVTFHPVTLEFEETGDQLAELLGALDAVKGPVVITYPNADTASRSIISAIEQFVKTHPQARAVQSLGSRRYYGLLKHASAMVGNSSSGIIEAASFGLPVVNVGNRQRGRAHGANVIHCECRRQAILAAIDRAARPTFRAMVKDLPNPYGDGCAAERIMEVLKRAPLERGLLVKRFHDMERTA